SPFVNAGYTLWKRGSFQIAASHERVIPDMGYIVRNSNLLKVAAPVKRTIEYGFQVPGKYDVFQGCVIHKGLIRNHGHGIWNNNFLFTAIIFLKKAVCYLPFL